MNTLLARAFDATFGHPRGIAGRLGGAIMARGNTEQEQWAVRHADLRPGAHVVAVGIGPGVGVAFAARAVAPNGRVVGVDPSATMIEMARARCAAHIDAAISVNNVMLWNRPAGFAELHRVLRPGGLLVITVHRHVLGAPPEQVRDELSAAGFTAPVMSLHDRRFNSPAVELQARRA